MPTQNTIVLTAVYDLTTFSVVAEDMYHGYVYIGKIRFAESCSKSQVSPIQPKITHLLYALLAIMHGLLVTTSMLQLA